MHFSDFNPLPSHIALSVQLKTSSFSEVPLEHLPLCECVCDLLSFIRNACVNIGRRIFAGTLSTLQWEVKVTHPQTTVNKCQSSPSRSRPSGPLHPL